MKELEDASALHYPRIKTTPDSINCKEFKKKYEYIQAEDSEKEQKVTLRGRVYSSRIAGSKLIFLDIVQDGTRVQALCNFGPLEAEGLTKQQFKAFYHLVRRGDIVEIAGYPHRTKRGELSIYAKALPEILTPALASLPEVLEDPQKRIQNRHIDTLVNKRVADRLRLRSHIIQYIRTFLLQDSFLEVQTPILAADAGGATARPFVTTATEFPSKKLSLRIAPEIWLKRLVIGGMDRVFEIGTVFRNEGIDATHNPEFTTCEFYKSFADLEELMGMTESMVSGLAQRVNELITSELTGLKPVNVDEYAGPFQRIEFIPALEKAMGRKFPDLASPSAAEDVKALYHDLQIPLPHSPTLPRLLDALAAHYLEPLFTRPTFLTHHPSCLAPLAKSFPCPTTHQQVSARAELFIAHKEIANMYEEENSPIAQRRKFEEQIQWKDEENEAVVDEGYVRALESGLPPTGGWGMGLERVCMMFAGAGRIGDVMGFGTLRNVVALGAEGKP
jgi:lysyl-tRNA synthetase class 2